MNSKTYILNPLAPFHLQTGGGDHESSDKYPRSDTLSSALLYWWFRQYGDVPGFPDQLPFRLSSAFPAIKTESGIKRLYPKPSGIQIDQDQVAHKVFKNVEWFDEDLFQIWQQGNDLSEYLPVDSNDPHLKRAGKVLTKDPESDLGIGKLAEIDTRTRVVLDRLNSSSTPFHFVRIIHNSDIRLWFMADIDQNHGKQFNAMVRLLGDEGLGADRTVGMGRYFLEDIQDADTSGKSDVSGYFNLGIFNPSDHEIEQIDWKQSFYELKNRGGWVSGKSIRRKPVPCIGENSILNIQQPLQGNVLCVVDKDDPNLSEMKMEYSVYRDCRGYFLPISR